MNHMLIAASPTRAPAREKGPRRYELDWCRTFVVLALIPIHTPGLFIGAANQIFGTRNVSPVSLDLLTSVGLWGMSLLFLVAGAGAYFALERRTVRQFNSEPGACSG